MKNRDCRLFFQDILECINQIAEFTKNVDYENFLIDDKTIKAVERCFEIMGEAAKYVPQDIRDRFNQIPYKSIMGMRNILIHDYLGINYEEVWSTVKNDLPVLKPQIENVLRILNEELNK
jgi:uncharacterized protein with HEPN domain